MQGVAFLTDSEVETLRLRELSAINTFAEGVATLQEWSDVDALQGLCEIMAIKGCGVEALPIALEAQDILRTLARGYTGEKMSITKDEASVFRDLYAFHDLQRTSICRSEYENYIELAANHKRSKSYLVEEIT